MAHSDLPWVISVQLPSGVHLYALPNVLVRSSCSIWLPACRHAVSLIKAVHLKHFVAARDVHRVTCNVQEGGEGDTVQQVPAKHQREAETQEGPHSPALTRV